MSTFKAPPAVAIPKPQADSTDVGRDEDVPLSGSPFARWLARLNHPIVVRMPRGFAVLIAIGILALIVLSYWVGYARKGHQAERIQGALPVDPRPHPTQTRLVPAVQSARIQGLNYLLLSTFPKPPGDGNRHRTEAERLVRYLRQHRVAATMENLDNGSIQVVDLKGFSDDQIGGAEYVAYKGNLAHLGRVWKHEHKGPREFSLWLRR